MAGIVYDLAGKELISEAESLNPFDVIVKSSADKANQVIEDGLHHVPVLDKIIDLKNESLSKIGEATDEVKSTISKQLDKPIKKLSEAGKSVIGLDDYKEPNIGGALTQEQIDAMNAHADEIARREVQLKAIAEHKKLLAKEAATPNTASINAQLDEFQRDVISGKKSFNDDFDGQPLHELQVDHQEQFYNNFFPDEDALSEKTSWNLHDRLTVMSRLKKEINETNLPIKRKAKLLKLLNKQKGSAIKIFEDGSIAYKGARNLSNKVIEEQALEPISDLTKVIQTTFDKELQEKLLTNQGIKIQPKNIVSNIEHFPTLPPTAANLKLLKFRKQLTNEVNQSDIFSGDGPDIDARIKANEARFGAGEKLSESPPVQQDAGPAGVTTPTKVRSRSGTTITQLKDLKDESELSPIQKQIDEKGKEKEFSGSPQTTDSDSFKKPSRSPTQLREKLKFEQDKKELIKQKKRLSNLRTKLKKLKVDPVKNADKIDQTQQTINNTQQQIADLKDDLITPEPTPQGTPRGLISQAVDPEKLSSKLEKIKKSGVKGSNMDQIPQDELEDLSAGRPTRGTGQSESLPPTEAATEAEPSETETEAASAKAPGTESGGIGDTLKGVAIGTGGAVVGGGLLIGVNKLEGLLDASDMDADVKSFLKIGLDQLKDLSKKIGAKGREQLNGKVDELENDLRKLAGLEARKSEVISLVNNPSTESAKNASNRRELDQLESAVRNQKEQIKANAGRINKDIAAAGRSAARSDAKAKAKAKADEDKDEQSKKALDKGIVQAMPPIVLNISNDSDNSKLKKTISPSSIVQTDNSKKSKVQTVSGDNNTTSQGSTKKAKKLTEGAP
jgi:hypothetical protein